MNLRRRPQEELHLNLIPLIDIVFMLLIFFIVTTTFNRDTEITVDLPVANSQPLKIDPELIEITVDAEGRFYVNQQKVVDTNIQTLKRALRNAARSLKDPPLLINADGKTPHQAVITAMDAARQLGFVHLSFATQPAPP